MRTLKSMSEVTSKFGRFIELFDISKVGLWEMTPEGDVIFYNENFYKIFDIPQTNSTLDDWIEIIDEEFKDKFRNGYTQHTSSREESFKSEYKVIDKFGNPRWIEAFGVADYDENGNMTCMIGSHTDITFLKNYNEKLYDLAYIEPISGIYNRQKLQNMIQMDLDEKRPATLILMSFYLIRHLFSLYGYEKTNQIVRDTVNAAMDQLDAKYIPFRISTSKFALLVQGKTHNEEVRESVRTIKEQIYKMRNLHNVGIDVDFHTAAISYPLENKVTTADEILNRAYLTIEDSKRNADSNISFYSSETQNHVFKHLFIESRLSGAIKRDEIFNVYQPIFDAQSNNLAGFEALVRWKTHEWGTIFPDAFIPVAEQNGSIRELGIYVFEKACQFIKAYNEKNHARAAISVNTSAMELVTMDYPKKIIQTIEKYGLDPSLITVEITESTMIDKSSSLILKNLTQLREYGMNISLDDFGTGYASLNSMIYTPISEVKIDREIMRSVMEKSLIKGFIKSVVQLCCDHNVSVVSEGIEDDSMVEVAQKMNVHRLQGYHFSKPLSEEDALDFKL